MDYSTLPNDPDHPPGTSPWQSSPQVGATPSPPTTKRSSYIGAADGHPEDYSIDQDNTNEERYEQDQGQEYQGNQPENGALLESGQRYPSNDPDALQTRQQVYQQAPQQQGQHQQQQRSGGPNRYRGTTRPAQRQNLPQYKLQAKITALERTGRKDPVLRFDVHVSHRVSLFINRTDSDTCVGRPISLNSAQLNLEMFVEHTPNSSNSQTT